MEILTSATRTPYKQQSIYVTEVKWTVHHCESWRIKHPNSNTQQSNNNTTNVVVQQPSRKLPEDGHINARNILSI